MLEGILWILATGAPWRDLPARFGAWQTVYGRFRAWTRSGLFDRVCACLRRGVGVERSLWCVDSTVIRASRSAGGARSSKEPCEPPDHALGRSRGGFGSKLSLVCDAKGLPLAAVLGPGQRHDLKLVEESLTCAIRGAGRSESVAGDKAYSTPWLREWLRQRSIRAVIPTRSDQAEDQSFDSTAYRGRNVVERLAGWLKESRRVATRYEKLAAGQARDGEAYVPPHRILNRT
jgi:transposase